MHCRNWTVRLMLLTPLLLVPFAVGCANDAKVVAQVRDFHSGLKPAVMEDQQLATYLQDVGDRIITAAGQYYKAGKGPASSKKEDSRWMFDSNTMKFHFVNSKTLNAFTTGGEHMYIYTELFQQCKSEDELAAVMSHEFAHVFCRHVEKGMDRQIGLTGLGLAAAGAGYVAGGSQNGATYAGAFGSAAALAGGFIGNSYTREDENEADKLGFIFYSRAGWDPNKFGDFFQTMIDKGYDTTPEMMSDHPTLKSRVVATKDRASRLPRDAANWRKPEVADDAHFRALQQRAITVGKTMPTDQQLQQTQQLLAALSRSCLTPRDNGALPDQTAAQQRVIADLNREQNRTAPAKKQQ